MKRVITIAFFATLVGLLAHFGVFFLLRFEIPEPASPPHASSEIRYVGGMKARANPILREQALLQDSAPLFMPTRWNLASEMNRVASLREATEVFNVFEPRLSLPDQLPTLEALFPKSQVRLADQLPQGPAFALAPLGKNPDPFPPAENQRLEVAARPLAAPAAGKVLTRPLPDSLSESAPKGLWTPPRMQLQVDGGRALGQPLIAQSSGFTEWDHVIQRYIGSLQFYRFLQDGYYEITVYP